MTYAQHIIHAGGKVSKLMVNEGVFSAKIDHDNMDTNTAAMTSNVSYGCISAGKGTIEGFYESLLDDDDDDEPKYVIYDN